MEDRVIQQIKDAIDAYEAKVSRIKELGYFSGSMFQSRAGNGHLQWWIRINGKKRYVRNSDFNELRAKYHRGKHLRRYAQECMERINIALLGKNQKVGKL